MWKTIFALVKEYGTQIFVSTHSKECIQGLVSASGAKTEQTTLLRAERSKKDNMRRVRSFSGSALVDGVNYGEEIR